MATTEQVDRLEEFLAWVKTCPYSYAISSMQGGFLHVKFFVEPRPGDNEVTVKVRDPKPAFGGEA